MGRPAPLLLAVALAVLTAQMTLAKGGKKVGDKSEQATVAAPTPSMATPTSAPRPGRAAAADPKDTDGICAAARAAERKTSCSTTDPKYKKERSRTPADRKQGLDECVKTCKSRRAESQHCRGFATWRSRQGGQRVWRPPAHRARRRARGERGATAACAAHRRSIRCTARRRARSSRPPGRTRR
jgi:hypothetical protein